MRNSVYLDFRDALQRLGKDVLMERYGNLMKMYHHAVNEDPLAQPMRISPSGHFTMGGLWTDYDMMSSIPGLFVGGEAGWAYHGANRLGANSLLSATVDGWFTLPRSVPNYLAPHLGEARPALTDTEVLDAVDRATQREEALLSIKGNRGPQDFHRELGAILYDGCGVERSQEKLEAAIAKIRALRSEFWQNVSVPGTGDRLNQVLTKAGRVADFLELGELMCIDALDRDESCGAHYRVEHQVEGECRRDDDNWAFVSAWQSDGAPQGATSDHTLEFTRHMEPLEFTAIPLARRNYK